MSTRTWLTGQAIAGLAASDGWGADMDEAVASHAVNIADAALARLEEKDDEPTALEQAVYCSCSCGGKGPQDGCCPACEVWHRLRGETIKHPAPQQGKDATHEQTN